MSKYFDRRAIVPQVTADPTGPDLPDIQGDVYYMFPKKFEQFIFFTIFNQIQFRQNLGVYRSRITSSAQTIQNIRNISNKVAGSDDLVSTQIAFSRAGLTYLGVRDNIGDPHFDQGSMRKEKDLLGDLAEYDRVFDEGKIHGVILVTAKNKDTCQAEADTIGNLFSRSVKIEETIEGRVRSDRTEHFGFRDGISQPALRGLCKPHNGQRIVKPGVIIMGYPGDPVFDKPDSIQRPRFTKNGTFMVFRKLEQDVCGFEKYVDENRGSDNRELFAAKMVGRFKSGAPLALTPRDDWTFTSPSKVNDFDYRSQRQSDACPFTAHTRQNAPRTLDPLISKEFLDGSAIVRAGIPYGDNITQNECNQWMSGPHQRSKMPKRGLLFVSYQSCISMGFFLLATGFANNEFFPTEKALRRKYGQDPILGGAQPIVRGAAPIVSGGRDVEATLTNEEGTKYQITGLLEPLNAQKTIVQGKAPIRNEGTVALELENDGKKYQVFGFAREVPSNNVASHTHDPFVIPRGGEYFFVPSISTIVSWAAGRA